jgi:hypothetical protein
MLLDDIIDLCREVARGAHVVDNERIDDRLWQDFLLLKRNQFIKNYVQEGSGHLEENTLQYEILDVEKYDPAYDLGGVSIGKYILRTELCPTIMECRTGVVVDELTSVDITSKTIQLVPFDRLRWCGNGKVNKNFLFAAWHDDRFYLRSGSEMEKPLTKLRVHAVFADPTLVSTYTRATDDYPMNDYMVEYAKNSILQTDFNIISQTRSDNTNDASGDVDPGSPRQISTQNKNH